MLSSLPWTPHRSDSWHPSPLPQKQTNQPDFSVAVLKVWSRAMAFTSPGNLLEMHILRLHARPRVRNSAGGPSSLCSIQLSRGFWCPPPGNLRGAAVKDCGSISGSARCHQSRAEGNQEVVIQNQTEGGRSLSITGSSESAPCTPASPAFTLRVSPVPCRWRVIVTTEVFSSRRRPLELEAVPYASGLYR